MKKVLSILVMVAMLISCVSITSAAGTTALTTPATTDVIATGTTADAEVSFATVADGTYFVEAIVYWPAAAGVSGVSVSAGQAFSADDLDATPVKSCSTAKGAYKTALTAAGVFSADYKYTVVTLVAASEFAAGNAATLTFEFDETPAAGTDLTYTAIITAATDADDNDVDFDDAKVAGAINFQADPLVGIYSEFTVFPVVDGQNEAASIAPGTATIDVDIRVDQSEGPWASRYFVLFPTAWTLVANKNGNVYADADYVSGDTSAVVASTSTFKAFKTAYQSFGMTEADLEGLSYFTVYCQPTDPDPYYRNHNNGVLATLTFEVPADAEVGATAVFNAVYDRGSDAAQGEIVYANPDGSYTALTPAVAPLTVTIACDHPSTTPVTEPATCKDGYTADKCDVCGELLNKTVLPATGNHTWCSADDAVLTEPTCTEDGYMTYTCTICGETMEITDPDSALGHAADLGTVTTDPTCTEDGVKTFTCTRCGETLGTEPVSALGHTEGAPVTTDPTCTEDGKTVVKCTECGEVLSDTPIQALGHDYDTVTTDPTCTENGYDTHTCSRCGDVYTDNEVDALGHDEVTDEKVDATCTTAGLTEGKHCGRCGETLVAQTTVNALGHNQNTVDHVDATYDADGHHDTYCDRCGELQSHEVLPRLTVTVEFTIVDEDGNEIAKVVVDGLYNDDDQNLADVVPAIPGYTFVDDMINIDENEGQMELVVTPNTDIKYTVKYVDEDGNKVADDKVVEGQTMATDVTETAIEVDGYFLISDAEQTITLEADDNVITFTYAVIPMDDDNDDPVNPPVKPDKPENNDKPVSPSTGDSMMYIILALVVALGATAAVVVIRRRKED